MFDGLRPQLLLPAHIIRLLVLPQPNKTGMPQVPVRGYFQELKVPHQDRHDLFPPPELLIEDSQE